ncbi:MAG: hypothetical protein NUW06_07880 [Candidatus Acetothermia bacterium]|jgi:hypothetical protein|nr:hypothetical protein [Candidatus Acetothermia bacterium]MDH7505953.1 pyruvate kinase alpha/beta domain-containing protein [Candidatus Acetothermia bacterium]
MTQRSAYFFEDCGPKNTDAVIEAVLERVREGDIQAIVVASMSGWTALKAAQRLKTAGIVVKVICVTGPPSWERYGYEMPLLKPKERKELERLGVAIVDQVEEPFRDIIFRNWWEKKTLEVRRPEADLFWMALICVGGHGFRTAIEAVFMALEAGLIKEGEKVIGVAGTGDGADSAVVMRAMRFEDAVGPAPEKRLKVQEILAMPKETTWAGYG